MTAPGRDRNGHIGGSGSGPTVLATAPLIPAWERTPFG